MQRVRRRHIYPLILLLLLLSICRGRFVRSSPAEILEPPATVSIARADQLPRWTLTSDDLRELLQLFSGRFFSHDDQNIQGVSLGGGIETDLLPPLGMPANPPQIFTGRYVLDQPSIAFWPDHPDGITLGSAPYPSFSPSFAPDFPRGSLNPPQPPTISQSPPTVGQLPPVTLPEPAMVIPFLFVLIPFRRRS
jgi:hypothetical protein